MPENAPSINLLPNKNESFISQFLTWTLTIGRLLIIIVEMLALGTFLYRFNLDMQIIDLHDKIEAQSFILDNFQTGEKNFRDLHDRLATIEKFNTVSTTTTSLFKDITNYGRGQVTFITLNVDTTVVTLEAEASNAASLSEFVEKLRLHPAVTAVSVDKVENNTTSAKIAVTLTATLKPTAFEQTKLETNTPNAEAAEASL